MAHWAKINNDNIVEEAIVTPNDDVDEGESWIAENLDGTWLKTSYNTKKGKHLLGGEPFRVNFGAPGSLYIPELDGFTTVRQEGEESFVLHVPTLSWVPAPIPEDATYALPYGPEPDFTEQEFLLETGEVTTGVGPDIKDTDNVYVWMAGENPGWWLNPNANYPKPEGDYVWDGFAKQWNPAPERPQE